MTIHHDKLAYGKLASDREEMSEEQILKMLKDINGEEEQPFDDKRLPDADESGKPK